MIQKQLFMPVLAAILSFGNLAQAQNAPQEQTSQSITRTAQSGNSLTTRLSKNIYRTETIQVPYTVQVPYQETETYTEQVPYTVQVPYTDYETDYRTERQCNNETRYRNEQRCENKTDYRQECHTQQECHLVPGNPGQCRNVEECGTNAQGQRICKTRQVCDGGSGPRQECSNRQVCQQVPYTHQECRNVQVPYTEYVCRDVQVPYQREVTKYRNETRYREETRTRTVTKYRTETRCCQPQDQQVFDHQEQLQVVVNFPQEALLQNQESESFVVALASLKPAQVSITNKSQLFGYRVVSQTQSGEILTVQLALTPLFDSSNAGQQTITNLSVAYMSSLQKFVVSFKDKLSHPKVQSASKVSVFELASGQLIEEGVAQNVGLGQLNYTVQANLQPNSQIRVVVQTTRAGSVVANGQLSFTNEKVYDKRVLTSDDIAVLSDSSQVELTAPNTMGLQTFIKLNDKTEKFDNVQTTYTLSLFDTTQGSLKAINTPQKISRDQAQLANNEVTLARLLAGAASKTLVSGRQIRAQIQVNRVVTDGSQANPTPFVVVVDMVIQ